MGRTIAIGDVHGCARELEKLLKKLNPQKSDRIIQLGDLINKGPDSHATISLARAYDIQTIMGNHEMRLLKAKKEKRLKELNGFYQETYKQLNKSDWKYLKQLPKFIYEHSLDTLFVHGGFCPNEPWHSQDLETITTVQVITKNGLPEKRTYGSKSKPWANYWEEDTYVVYGHTPRMRIFKKRNTLCIDTGCVYGGNSPPTQSKKTDSFLLRQSVLTAKRFLGIEYLLNHYGRHCHRSWHSHNQHE